LTASAFEPQPRTTAPYISAAKRSPKARFDCLSTKYAQWSNTLICKKKIIWAFLPM